MLESSSIHAECQTSPKQNGHFNLNGNAASLQRFVNSCYQCSRWGGGTSLYVSMDKEVSFSESVQNRLKLH